MKTEVKVFLNCLSCGTFLTSPSFPVIRKHFEKCHLSKGLDSSVVSHRNPVDSNHAQFNLECDKFIDDEIETVTFTQPFVVLTKYDLEHSDFKEPKIPNCSTKRKHQNSILRPRKSRLEAAKNLSRQMNFEAAPDEDTVTSFAISKDAHGLFNCNVCSTRCKTKPSLKRHLKNIHNTTFIKYRQTRDTFFCSVCNRTVTCKGASGVVSFQDHLHQHEDAEASEKKFNLWKVWPQEPKSEKCKIKFSCKYCLKSHSNHRDFLSHMATEHSDKGTHFTFQCSHNCSTQVDSIKELIAHFKSDHPKVYFGSTMKSDEFILSKSRSKKQKCEQCGKFFELSYLATHQKKLHSIVSAIPKNSYKCPYPKCTITCKTVALLRRHVILHLEKNPYVCNFLGCKAKADAPSHLLRHMRQKHLEAPPICSKCGVTYTSRDRLKEHNCDANIKKVQSGQFKLVDIKGFWRLKPVESKIENLPLDPRFISAPRLEKYDPNDKVNQYIQSLKQININTIICSDPGFIQVCKNSPGFGQLLLGSQYNREFGPLEKRKLKIYKCSKCLTMFTGLQGIKKHKAHCTGNERESSEVNVSPGKGKVGCSLCGKSFERDATLEQHVSQDHSPNEVFKCDEPGCGRYFISEFEKQRHLQYLHVHRPYHCEKCRFALRLKPILISM